MPISPVTIHKPVQQSVELFLEEVQLHCTKSNKDKHRLHERAHFVKDFEHSNKLVLQKCLHNPKIMHPTPHGIARATSQAFQADSIVHKREKEMQFEKQIWFYIINTNNFNHRLLGCGQFAHKAPVLSNRTVHYQNCNDRNKDPKC